MVDAREDGNVPGHATRTVYFRTSGAVAEVDSEIREVSNLRPRGEGRRSAGQYADYAMGNDPVSFRLSDDDSKKYDVVKGKFDSQFVKRRNVIYE